MTDKSTVLILRTCHQGFLAHNDFRWPSAVGATVTPERWNPAPVCGDGLHGFLKGQGAGSLADWGPDAEWLVIEAEAASVVVLDNGAKVKVPSCVVAHVGKGATAVERRLDCLAFMQAAGQLGEAPIGRVAVDVGDRSTLTGGYRSTLTGGDRSTLTGGYGSTLTGGDGSTLTGGYGSTLTGGDRSTLTGGDGSTLTGGDRSTLTGGYRSTLTGGYGSTLTVKWYDQPRGSYRRRLYTVGEDGILPAIKYTCNESGVLVPVGE